MKHRHHSVIKLFNTCLILLILFFLSSFKESDVIVDPMDFTLSTYASSFSATITKSSSPDFDANIIKIYYNPQNHKICLTYNIHDDDFYNAVYFVVMQERRTWLSEDYEVYMLDSNQFEHQD